MDKYVVYRIIALQEAANCFQSMPIPVKRDGRVFYFNGNIWLVDSAAENEVRWQAIGNAGPDMIKIFRKVWQYIGQHGGTMFVYRLRLLDHDMWETLAKNSHTKWLKENPY